MCEKNRRKRKRQRDGHAGKGEMLAAHCGQAQVTHSIRKSPLPQPQGQGTAELSFKGSAENECLGLPQLLTSGYSLSCSGYF